MTKQERIREGIISKVKSICNWRNYPDIDPLSAEDDAKDIISHLHSQGVVIKAKCPDCEWSQFGEEAVGMTPCYSCNSTGYIIETLIENEITK